MCRRSPTYECTYDNFSIKRDHMSPHEYTVRWNISPVRRNSRWIETFCILSFFPIFLWNLILKKFSFQRIIKNDLYLNLKTNFLNVFWQLLNLLGCRNQHSSRIICNLVCAQVISHIIVQLNEKIKALSGSFSVKIEWIENYNIMI
jgi:hypothetical protein